MNNGFRSLNTGLLLSIYAHSSQHTLPNLASTINPSAKKNSAKHQTHFELPLANKHPNHQILSKEGIPNRHNQACGSFQQQKKHVGFSCSSEPSGCGFDGDFFALKQNLPNTYIRSSRKPFWEKCPQFVAGVAISTLLLFTSCSKSGSRKVYHIDLGHFIKDLGQLLDT